MYTFIIPAVSLAVCSTAASLVYMSFVSAKYNGWRDLASIYRWRQAAPENSIGFQSANLNRYSFPRILTLGTSEQGLFLKPLGLGLLFHPALLIPWEKLRCETFQDQFTSGIKLVIPEERFELELTETTRHQLVELIDDDWNEARTVLLSRHCAPTPQPIKST